MRYVADLVTITELWKAGKFSDAFGHFCQCIGGDLIGREEAAKFWELIKTECEQNARVMFNLYELLKQARNWDDKRLCKELGISGKAIEDIKNRRKPTSEGVGLKILYELFPQMAV